MVNDTTSISEMKYRPFYGLPISLDPVIWMSMNLMMLYKCIGVAYKGRRSTAVKPEHRTFYRLLLGEEEFLQDPHGIVRAVDGVTDSPRVVVNLVIVSALVGLAT
jgi:hypothetical protein